LRNAILRAAKKSRRIAGIPSFAYLLSLSNGAKLKCTLRRGKMSFGLMVVAGFQQIWGLDNIFSGLRFKRAYAHSKTTSEILMR
jgi:hypothetical protein